MLAKVLALIAALEKAAPELQEIWAAIVALFGDKLSGLVKGDAEFVDEATAARLREVCEARLAEPPSVAGRIFPGDGSVLKALIQLAITLLPLILEPKPES